VRRAVFVIAIAATLASTLGLTIFADDTKTVNATVTPAIITVNVSPSTVTYGTKQIGATNVPSNPDHFAATNAGSVPEDFVIKGANTVGGAWTLAATAGEDTYVHRFSLNGSIWTALTTTNQALGSNVTPGTGEVDVFLQMDLPTSSASTAQQTAPVLVTASLH
jgi:hypothetical protein